MRAILLHVAAVCALATAECTPDDGLFHCGVTIATRTRAMCGTSTRPLPPRHTRARSSSRFPHSAAPRASRRARRTFVAPRHLLRGGAARYPVQPCLVRDDPHLSTQNGSRRCGRIFPRREIILPRCGRILPHRVAILPRFGRIFPECEKISPAMQKNISPMRQNSPTTWQHDSHDAAEFFHERGRNLPRCGRNFPDASEISHDMEHDSTIRQTFFQNAESTTITGEYFLVTAEFSRDAREISTIHSRVLPRCGRIFPRRRRILPTIREKSPRYVSILRDVFELGTSLVTCLHVSTDFHG